MALKTDTENERAVFVVDAYFCCRKVDAWKQKNDFDKVFVKVLKYAQKFYHKVSAKESIMPKNLQAKWLIIGKDDF